MVAVPGKVSAIAVTGLVERALAPAVGLIQLCIALAIGVGGGGCAQRIDDSKRRAIGHRLGESAIDQEKLRIVVMPAQVPALYAVELAVAQDELHVLVF